TTWGWGTCKSATSSVAGQSSSGAGAAARLNMNRLRNHGGTVPHWEAGPFCCGPSKAWATRSSLFAMPRWCGNEAASSWSRRQPDVRLYSLQKGYGSEQLVTVPDWGIVDLGPSLDLQESFLDTAAVMRHLDLMVCCDSALLHLAGALAVPTWAALSVANDWRW